MSQAVVSREAVRALTDAEANGIELRNCPTCIAILDFAGEVTWAARVSQSN